MKLKLALICALGVASANAMACFTVYDQSNQMVYNSQTPPVDMSRPIHETLPAVFPGGHMVFGIGTDCPREAPVKLVATPPPAKPSPLLTDRSTAAAMNLQHTVLPSGVALVSNPPAMGAGLTVVATSTPAPARTPVLAPSVTVQRARRPETVITEMYDPPLTVIQQGGMVIREIR